MLTNKLVCINLFIIILVTQNLVYSTTEDLNKIINEAQILIDNYYGNDDHLDEATQIIIDTLNKDEQFAPAYVQLSRIILIRGYIVDDGRFSLFKGNTLEKATSNTQACT